MCSECAGFCFVLDLFGGTGWLLFIGARLWALISRA